MNNQENSISIDEAKAALDSIAASNRVAYDSVTPPFWLKGLVALLLGMLTIFGAWSSGSSLWTFVTLVTVFILMIIFIGYYWILKSRGIKLLINPVNKADKVISFLGSFSTAVLLVISIELYRDGYSWVSYFAGIINFALVFFLMSKYSINGVQIKRGQ